MERPTLSVSQVIRLVQVSRKTVLRWEAAGLMPRAFRCGKVVRFYADEIDAWIRQRVESPPKAKRRRGQRARKF